jgi:hypothetical protein
LTAQFSQQMFCVHIPGDELGALTHHFCQNGFPTSPDEGHVREFNNTPACIACAVKSFPGRAQLGRPITHQAALQGPSLLLGRFGDIDLQHVFLKARDCVMRFSAWPQPALNPNREPLTRIGMAVETPNPAARASEPNLVVEVALNTWMVCTELA